jgi:membrane-associated phospholipid phosphatase
MNAAVARCPRLVRAAPLLSFTVVTAAGVRRHGFPTSPDRLLLWLGSGLLCYAAIERHRIRRLFVQWLPFAGLLLAYDVVRGVVAATDARAHALPQVWTAKLFGDGSIPAVWLQHHLWRGAAHLQWYDYASWLVYASHFVVTPILAAVLWSRSAQLFRRFATMVGVLALTAVATYAAFPAMPPWLASEDHIIPHTTRLMDPIAAHITFVDLRPLFEAGERYANDVAAIPSLHAGYSLLAALFLASCTRRRWHRAALLLYPLAMAFALVYGAEHYTLDVVLGWLYAAVAYAAVGRLLSPRRPSPGRLRRPAAGVAAPRSSLPVPRDRQGRYAGSASSSCC